MALEPGVHNITLDPRGSYRENYDFVGLDFTDMPEMRSEVRDRPEGDILYISVNEVPNADGYITVTVTDATHASVQVYYSPEATARLAGVRRGSWDLFGENTNGEDVPKLLLGTVSVRPSVTDPSND